MSLFDRIEQLMAENTALRARVADLEATESLHWITEVELRQSRARVAELKDQGRNACELFDHLKTAQKQLNESNRELAQTTAALKLNKQLRERTEQRNAELVAALREEKRIHPEDFQQGDFRERALAAARKQGGAA